MVFNGFRGVYASNLLIYIQMGGGLLWYLGNHFKRSCSETDKGSTARDYSDYIRTQKNILSPVDDPLMYQTMRGGR